MALWRRNSKKPTSAMADTTAVSKYQPVVAIPRLDSPNHANNGATKGAQHAAQAAKATPAAPAVPAFAAVEPRFICVSLMISPFNCARMLCLHQVTTSSNLRSKEFLEESTMSQPNLTIGALATHTSTNVPTIRYYEEIGLLPQARRSTNGRRYYRDTDLKRLTFIKRCRDFGFPIEQVRELVNLLEDGDRSCIEVRDLAQMRLDTVRARLQEMRQLEASLVSFVESCDEACCKGPTRDCTIIEVWSTVESEKSATGDGRCCATPQRQMKKLTPVESTTFKQIRRT
jgi:DNA-binding transcriptional MerR regulator